MDEEFWINFAKELAFQREKERSKLPYNFNLLDELHANENAHTRILIKLLNYSVKGKYIYLKSFLNMWCIRKRLPDFPITEVQNPEIVSKQYIDALIEEPSLKYAIIIENKIEGAVDQDKQIENYFNKVKQHGVDEKNIYIIYLTNDGSKKISPKSLPEGLKSSLGNRFIEMNYREDVLPWLKNDILPEIRIKETLIESGIRQYIDYLEGRFGLRELEKTVRTIMNKSINEKLGLDKMAPYDKWLRLNRSVKEINNLLNDLKNMQNDITMQVVKQWDEHTRQYFDRVSNNLEQGYYQIYLDGIPNAIHFEWGFDKESLFSGNGYLMALHVENDMTDIYKDRLSRIIKLEKDANDIGFKPSSDSRTILEKEYKTPGGRSFADLKEGDKIEFFRVTYEEIKKLKETIENTFHKFEGEETFILKLRDELNNRTTPNKWRVWPSEDNCWDVVTRFNCDTHEIGIEGFFVVNIDMNVEFRSSITVWKAQEWGVYKERLKKEYPDNRVEKVGERVYLHLSEILIGNDLGYWPSKIDEVVESLRVAYFKMSEITTDIGK